MGNYRIIDTGYANKTNSGTQETRANSGNYIEFSSFRLVLNTSNNESTAPNPGRYEDAETNFVSFNNPTLVLSGVVDRTTSAYETLTANCDALRRTKGLKLLYYSDTADGYKSIVNAIGSTSHGSLSVGGGIKSVLCTVGSFTITESAGSKLAQFTINIKTTNPTE